MLISDKEILNTVNGMNLDFEDIPKSTIIKTKPSTSELSLRPGEVNKLLKKGVIKNSKPEELEYISPVFLRKKQDGSHRLILNLKFLNKHLEYNHFKMDTFKLITHLIRPNCFMSTIDLKDAYYSVKNFSDHTKNLKFCLEKDLYEFVVLPNGLSSGPRKFTKLTKPHWLPLDKTGLSLLFI